MQTHFVTRAGLGAAISDPAVLDGLKSIVLGHSTPTEIRQFKKRGLIAAEKRDNPIRVDHNALVVDGAIDRIREVLKPAAKSVKTNGHTRQLAPRIGYVATRPGSHPRDLTPSLQAVFEALGKRPKRIADLCARVKDVHPNTVRWAVQILRQRKLARSVELA